MRNGKSHLYPHTLAPSWVVPSAQRQGPSTSDVRTLHNCPNLILHKSSPLTSPTAGSSAGPGQFETMVRRDCLICGTEEKKKIEEAEESKGFAWKGSGPRKSSCPYLSQPDFKFSWSFIFNLEPKIIASWYSDRTRILLSWKSTELPKQSVGIQRSNVEKSCVSLSFGHLPTLLPTIREFHQPQWSYTSTPLDAFLQPLFQWAVYIMREFWVLRQRLSVKSSQQICWRRDSYSNHVPRKIPILKCLYKWMKGIHKNANNSYLGWQSYSW